MHEARDLRQGCGPERRLVADRAHQAAPAHLLAHPALEKWLRALPKVEVRVELAPEALDVEQRLLQHDELRLHLDVEASRGLKKAQQQFAEVDLFQRPREHRLADGANRGLELVDARGRGHPARVEVRLRDAPVVAVEESEEVLREVARSEERRVGKWRRWQRRSLQEI